MNNEDTISRAALLGWAREFYPEEKQFQSAVINAPTIPPPVVHGRWKGAGMGDYYCSLCQETFSGGDEFKYCPNCGAKMDLEV